MKALKLLVRKSSSTWQWELVAEVYHTTRKLEEKFKDLRNYIIAKINNKDLNIIQNYDIKSAIH